MIFQSLRAGVSLCLACACFPLAAAGETSGYPDRPVRIVVPFPAGGPTDVLARVLGQEFSKKFGQPFLIDNRGGGNTIIGAEYVARAKPDGHTLLLAIDNTLVMNQFLYSKLPYNPVRDFEPVGKAAVTPLLLIGNAKGPATTAALIKEAKANPGRITYGFGAFTSQLAGEVINQRLALNMQAVPYKGSNSSLQGILAGDITFIIGGVSAALPHIKGGRLRALSKLGREEVAALPELPNFAREAGLSDFDVAIWMGLVAPGGTPPRIIAELNAVLQAALREPAVEEKLLAAGMVPAPSGAREFKALIESEAKKWKPVIEQANLRVD